MPTLGILGMTTHRIGKLAQIMYAEYDLNKSQSMILFQLHKSGRISQKDRAKCSLSSFCTFDYVDDPEDGKVRIYSEKG